MGAGTLQLPPEGDERYLRPADLLPRPTASIVLVLSEPARAAADPALAAITPEEHALAVQSDFRRRLALAYTRCGLPVVDADGTPDEVVERVKQVHLHVCYLFVFDLRSRYPPPAR